MNSENSPAATFEPLRGRLFGLAYRMLASRAEADDVVQDTYVRWHQADRGQIESPEAWLVTIATRIATVYAVVNPDKLAGADGTSGS